MRVFGEVGSEECFMYIRFWKNKYGDGFCVFFLGKCVCIRGV